MNIGSLEEAIFGYEDFGISADTGLRYFAQTSDGFIHVASSTSTFEETRNGINLYIVEVFADQFSPLLSTSINTVNVRYADNAAGTIFLVPDYGSINGSNHDFVTEFLNTVNDPAFNN